jgi:TPR repeat protein
MSGKAGRLGLIFAVALQFTAAAHADLAGAQKAYAAKDFEGAFQQYLEVATLGNLAAQENLAAMYVGGEGVTRDNVLGYAWAVIARENGGTAATQNIIDQLQPHLDDRSRARVQAVIDDFGKAALAQRLLPAQIPPDPTSAPKDRCRMTRPTNPDAFYPPAAKREDLSGAVLIEAVISPDGHVHRPYVWYSVPEGIFEQAGRGIAWTSGYSPKRIDGVAQQCAMRYKATFHASHTAADDRITDAYKKVQVLAEQGDPRAQLLYGQLMFDRESALNSEKNPLDWYVKAAQAGLPYAQYLVGVELLFIDRRSSTHAREIEAEKAKGLTWLQLAAANGRAEAKFALANYRLRKDPAATSDATVFAWLEDAAKAGHRDATLYLAALLAASPDASRRDPARALALVDLKHWDFEADPAAFEVIAAAYAQSAKFSDAVDAQQRAIRTAQKYRWNTAALDKRLETFQAGSAWTGNLMAP